MSIVCLPNPILVICHEYGMGLDSVYCQSTSSRESCGSQQLTRETSPVRSVRSVPSSLCPSLLLLDLCILPISFPYPRSVYPPSNKSSRSPTNPLSHHYGGPYGRSFSLHTPLPTEIVAITLITGNHTSSQSPFFLAPCQDPVRAVRLKVRRYIAPVMR